VRPITRICLAALLTAAAVLAVGSPTARAADPEGTRNLFNGRNLRGWYRFLNGHELNEDPDKVFSVRNGRIHVSGETYGYIMTRREFENYHLIVEFRWGEKKYYPSPNRRRDSGILYHCTGEDRVWPMSIECQIQEGDTGDFWLVGGTHIEVPFVSVSERERNSGNYRIPKFADYEKPTGEWNSVEVLAVGDRAWHLVNGQEVNRGEKATVARGKILLQSEGAEVEYRRVDLHPAGNCPVCVR